MNRENEYGMPSQRYYGTAPRRKQGMRCGDCRFRKKDFDGDGWSCLCDNSEFYLEETPFDFFAMSLKGGKWFELCRQNVTPNSEKRPFCHAYFAQNGLGVTQA